jgi:hypothetical protein
MASTTDVKTYKFNHSMYAMPDHIWASSNIAELA